MSGKQAGPLMSPALADAWFHPQDLVLYGVATNLVKGPGIAASTGLK